MAIRGAPVSWTAQWRRAQPRRCVTRDGNVDRDFDGRDTCIASLTSRSACTIYCGRLLFVEGDAGGT
jgi:hypothetical protein